MINGGSPRITRGTHSQPVVQTDSMTEHHEGALVEPEDRTTNKIKFTAINTTTKNMDSTVMQSALNENEVFNLHPTDTTKILAWYRIENPYASGAFYEQRDELPMVDQTVQSPSDPLFYFIPDLASAKIPSRSRPNKRNNYQAFEWTYQPVQGHWTRPAGRDQPNEVWRPIIFFRRFDARTHKYEEAYTSIAKLRNVNPNDKKYMYAYNKWIDQIRRRRDSKYNKVVIKDHWTIIERCALYAAINSFVRKSGLHNLGFGQGFKMGQKELRTMADTVNRVGGKARKIDAVRGQIMTAHEKKNKAIFDLMQRAQILRGHLGSNESITRADIYPTEAILPSLFPSEPTDEPKEKKGKGEDKNKKGEYDSTKVFEKRKFGGRRKREFKSSALITDNDDSDLSDAPSGLLTPPPRQDLRPCAPEDTNENDLWTDTGEGVSAGEFEKLDEMDWETCSDWTEKDLDDERSINDIPDKAGVKEVPLVHFISIQSQPDQASSGAGAVTPRRRKRKLEAIKGYGDDRDDESEKSSHQVLSVKKMRISPHMKTMASVLAMVKP
ncbi:hypothetical protein GQ44DRAFT_768010 [Phaeosphaeriaceae sp. PMI808]|nr:hypothetical protein GQ44DRAFT_768010 [Phaeosphaeriaceae sp. PMI808]